LIDSAGVPWTAAYIDSRSEPTADLRSNIAAESRAKIVLFGEQVGAGHRPHF
jgi:Mn-containing catalase